MTNYDVLREFDAGLTERQLEQAVERSAATVEKMRADGMSVSYLGSEVFTAEDGLIWATVCRYDADSEGTIRTHSERAELPVRHVFRRGTAIEGIAPKSGVVPKAA